MPKVFLVRKSRLPQGPAVSKSSKHRGFDSFPYKAEEFSSCIKSLYNASHIADVQSNGHLLDPFDPFQNHLRCILKTSQAEIGSQDKSSDKMSDISDMTSPSSMSSLEHSAVFQFPSGPVLQEKACTCCTTAYQFDKKKVDPSSPIYSEAREVGKQHVANAKPFLCHVCGKSFRLSSTLCRHKIIHTSQRPHKCFVCFKSFNRSSTLKTHLRTHNESKEFVCHSCGKGFHQKGNLRNHILIHTGEKPYACKVCAKSFNKLSNLKFHMHSHTDHKPYRCRICKLAMARRGELKQHLAAYHPAECNECE